MSKLYVLATHAILVQDYFLSLGLKEGQVDVVSHPDENETLIGIVVTEGEFPKVIDGKAKVFFLGEVNFLVSGRMMKAALKRSAVELKKFSRKGLEEIHERVYSDQWLDAMFTFCDVSGFSFHKEALADHKKKLSVPVERRKWYQYTYPPSTMWLVVMVDVISNLGIDINRVDICSRREGIALTIVAEGITWGVGRHRLSKDETTLDDDTLNKLTTEFLDAWRTLPIKEIIRLRNESGLWEKEKIEKLAQELTEEGFVGHLNTKSTAPALH
jgi:hypothetical protein